MFPLHIQSVSPLLLRPQVSGKETGIVFHRGKCLGFCLHISKQKEERTDFFFCSYSGQVHVVVNSHREALDYQCVTQSENRRGCGIIYVQMSSWWINKHKLCLRLCPNCSCGSQPARHLITLGCLQNQAANPSAEHSDIITECVFYPLINLMCRL